MKQRLLLPLMLVLLSACSATVPKEVVELSYRIEQDLTHVQESYTDLVHQHIKVLRKQREDYLRHEWIPQFVKGWVKDGQLVQMAEGDVIYDEAKGEFVKTRSTDRGGQLNSIVLWADSAVTVIEEKRHALLAPLDEAERTLIADINQSFALIQQGHQTITAHLNSIREVQDVQNDLLDNTGLEAVRDQINQQLSALSEKATAGLDDIRQRDKKANKHLE
ncbi:hypothetical protein [Enterovibrio norvegicus]|uniref:hypothetical protein n=1 Tax=Enterovibrio norvegicus TaxID=188144 RepID=UPI00352F8DDD